MTTRNRNSRGRFRTRKARRGRSSALNIRITSPDQFQRIFRKHGMKIMIVVSDDTCPHCVKYKSTWNSLGKTPGRNVHMVSMPSSTYNETPLAKQSPVTGVPSVLFVDPAGSVVEVDDIRNTTKMTNLLTTSENPTTPSNTTTPSLSDQDVDPSGTIVHSFVGPDKIEIPGLTPVSTSENPLKPLPANTQKGGNPWSAFLMAASQAAPAAALLGAYSMIPKRSSGLSNPSRKKHRHR